MLLQIAAVYFAISIVSLPFANGAWRGEVSVPALVQLPMIWVTRFFQNWLNFWSPPVDTGDYIYNYYASLLVTVALPCMAVIACVRLTKPHTIEHRWSRAVLGLAMIDTVLKLFFNVYPSMF